MKIVQGVITICSLCKKIRDDQDAWVQPEVYLDEYSDAKLSHGLCPKCFKISKTTPYLCNGLKTMTKHDMYEGKPHQSLPPWHLSPIYGVVRHGQGHLFAFVRHVLSPAIK